MTDAKLPDWPVISAALRQKAFELCGGLAIKIAPSTALLTAYFEVLREEFRASVAASGAEAELEVAKQMMRDEHYGEDMLDLICGVPGFKAPIAMVDGKEAVCLEYAANINPRPLSAYFLNRVREAIEIAAKVGALEMQRAEGKTSEIPGIAEAGEPERAFPGGNPSEAGERDSEPRGP